MRRTRKAGRIPRNKFLIDAEHRARFMLAARQGFPFSLIADVHGIPVPTAELWLTKGRKLGKAIADGEESESRITVEEKQYLTFAREYDEARALCGHKVLGVIMQKVLAGEAKYACWVWEKLFHMRHVVNGEDKANASGVVIQRPDGSGVQIIVSELPKPKEQEPEAGE